MSKSKVPLKSEYVCELTDLVWEQKELPVLPEGCSDTIATENKGDAALLRAEYSEAIRLYASLGTTVQRVRHKLAWCYFHHGQTDAALPLLHDAEKAPGTLVLALLGFVLEAVDQEKNQWTSSQTRERIAELTRIARKRPDPVPPIFILAERYINAPPERRACIVKAYQHYPKNPAFRQNYLYLATREQLISNHAMLDIAMPAARAETATVDDLWAALHVACHCGSGNDAGEVLALLKKRQTPSPGLLLVEGDLALQFGRAAEAFRTFAHVLQLVEGADEVDTGAFLAWSLRGLIHAAVLAHKNEQVTQYAVELAELYRDGQLPEKWQTLHDPGDGFLFEFTVPVKIGEDSVRAQPLTDLSTLREQLFAADLPDSIRGIYRAGFIARDWGSTYGSEDEPGQHDRTRAAVLTEVEKLVVETSHPCIGSIVGELLLEKKCFERAGYALAGYSLARKEVYQEAEGFASDRLADDATAEEIRLYAQGFLRCFQETLKAQPLRLALYGYAVVEGVLREHLLDEKLYPEFEALMQSIEQAAQQIETTCLDEHAWFDIGLAYHYMKRNDAAKAAYRRCLEMDPDFSSARKNLDMLLSPEDRKREICQRYIASLTKRPPPASLEEMSFADAVYLLTLYRACGGLEQDNTLRPFNDSEFPFSPTSELRQPLFGLLGCALVHISPMSPVSAFDVDLGKGTVSGVYMHKLFWELPAHSITLLKAVESAAITGKWPRAWHEQAPALAMDLARGECLEYLEHAAEERGFDVQQGDKPRLMFDNLLTTYSVAQCYGLIYRGARNASDYRQRKSITRAHATNLMISSIQRFADQARAEGWDISAFSRIKECPRSMLSYVLHDTFLRTGERSFITPVPELFADPAKDPG